ncbi:electron transport complex subunit RsxB [Xylophilus sp.]|uniref:electron transport complex subunit RsxB n=1 Tax=Xylophilus sp. TaxID=2653893 RepID=UPI0013BDA719|nr:electron transport complex subunit RsxB [Xylophilus sp.]KAF1047269.1 MAG: Electron transport complex subunit RsxB [Xylophilus sp.]
MPPTAADPTLLALRIDTALPQTQCTRCGYPDCAGYAQAVAAGEAGINQCPPGGEEGIRRLAAITGRPPAPLSAEHGIEGPRTVAWIDEDWCIGCTLCLKACPTDAIAGANKRMHTVIEQWCTGCERCIPVCPVDCIHLDNASGERTGWAAWSAADAAWARERYGLHAERQRREERENAQRLQSQAQAKLADIAAHSSLTDPAVLDRKRSLIEAALARAKARR